MKIHVCHFFFCNGMHRVMDSKFKIAFANRHGNFKRQQIGVGEKKKELQASSEYRLKSN